MKYSIPLIFLFLALPLLAAEKSGKLEGTIISHDNTTNSLTVQHGNVEGVMGAMTMTYQVRGQKVTALPPNVAKITATLHEDNGAYWLTNVKAVERHEMSGHAMSGMPNAKTTNATRGTFDLN